MDPQQTTQPQQPAIPSQPPSTPAPAKTPPPSKPKLKLKFLLLLGILIIGLILGIYFLLASKTKSSPQLTPKPTQIVESTLIPSPDSTVNWQTYTNSQHKYSVKYPPDWYLDTRGVETIILFSYNPENVENPGLPVSGGRLKIDITSEQNIENLPLLEFVIKKGFLNRENIVSSNEIIISDKQALKIISKGLYDLEDQTFFLNNEAEVVIFQVWGGLPDKYKQTLDLILSTFTFLDKEEAPAHGTGAIRSVEKLKNQFCKDISSGITISYSEAIEIAQKNRCGLQGEELVTYTENYLCNENTGTWWVDLIIKPETTDCNPACVVNVVNKTAEINWRCTGAIPH